MSEVDDFLDQMLPRLLEEGKAIHSGDPTLRLTIWSSREPVAISARSASVTLVRTRPLLCLASYSELAAGPPSAGRPPGPFHDQA
jgi:hypothetical protein